MLIVPNIYRVKSGVKLIGGYTNRGGKEGQLTIAVSIDCWKNYLNLISNYPL